MCESPYFTTEYENKCNITKEAFTDKHKISET